MSSDLRKHPRYFVPGGVPAVLGDASVDIVDLSSRGARIQMKQPLPVGAGFMLTLRRDPELIATRCTVRWCHLSALALDDASSDTFLVGIAFEEPVAAIGELVDQLLAASTAVLMTDARQTERYFVTVPIYASFADADDARLIDVSIRGARLSNPDALRVGTKGVLRFHLSSGPAVDVRAVVMWCAPSEHSHDYDIGLSIGDEESLLRAVIAQLCMRKHARADVTSMRRKFDPARWPQRSGALPLAS